MAMKTKTRRPAAAKAETEPVEPQSKPELLGISEDFSKLIAHLKFIEARWSRQELRR